MALTPRKCMSEEIVTLVDINDQVIGQAPRSKVRKQALIHRVTYILVFNEAGQLLLQKRTAVKDLYPDYYDAAAGGVLSAGETYEASAERELKEELGINDTPLRSHFDHYFESPDNRCWGRVFTCVHNGPFTLQASEVQSAQFVDIESVLEGHFQPLTPDTDAVLRRWAAHRCGQDQTK